MESAIAFGEEGNLIGTLSIPNSRSSALSSIGFVFFNAGVVHRVGPHRINVKVARALAEKGVPSIRFDLAGLGDSGRSASKMPVSHAEQAIKDIRSALDVLAATAHVEKFVLCAVCSGTVHSFDAAMADPRIQGLMLLDSYMYPTVRTRVRYFLMRAKRRLSERTAVAWIVGRLSGRSKAAVRSVESESLKDQAVGNGFSVGRPAKKSFVAMLNLLTSRGTRVCMLYAGSSFEHYNYANQFRDAFAGYHMSPLVRSPFLADSDHTVTRVTAQQEFIQFLQAWVNENFAIDRQDRDTH
jgi:pimeloyl-ACP methyl ester carboxylesterase